MKISDSAISFWLDIFWCEFLDSKSFFLLRHNLELNMLIILAANRISTGPTDVTISLLWVTLTALKSSQDKLKELQQVFVCL